MLLRKAQNFLMAGSKYGNKKVVRDGIKFDSIAEAKYYEQLKWLQEHKQILFFRTQPRYLLLEAFDKGGQHFRKIEYVADFEIHNLDGSIQVVDVKGMETDVFKIKRKLFEFKYPHKLVMLTYDDNWGFIETEKLKKLERKAVKSNANHSNRRRSPSLGKKRR